MVIRVSTWKAPVANSPATSRISPAWTTQRPSLRGLNSNRLTRAAVRLTTSTRPTSAPPGNSGSGNGSPRSWRQTSKLRM